LKQSNIAALGGDTDPFSLNAGFALNGFSVQMESGSSSPSTYFQQGNFNQIYSLLERFLKKLGLTFAF
jgi:hypothetical protein